jgi:hypothetical protein
MQFPIRFSLGSLLILLSHAAWSADPASETPDASGPLEVNNQWSVNIANSVKFESPLYVTLKRAGNHWDIDGLYNVPPKLRRSQDLELFMATRDFQQWTNFYTNMRTDCDKFEVLESDFHSVCTSGLAEKKTGLGIVGAFFNGGGKIPFAYANDKVRAAINSIRPEQATEILTAFEQGTLTAQRQSQTRVANQQAESRQAEAAQAAARRAAPMGAKDWCEQTVKQSGIFVQVESTYTCQNYGVVSEEGLRNEGWAITTKRERKVGYAPQMITVYDISIEKVPR